MKILLEDLLDEFQEWVSEKRVKRIPYEEWRELVRYQSHFVEIRSTGWARVGLFDITEQKPLLIPIKDWFVDDGSFGKFLEIIYHRDRDRDDSKTMEDIFCTLSSNTSALTNSISKMKDSWDNAVTIAAENIKNIQF